MVRSRLNFSLTICCLAAPLLGSSVTGCYTDPINREPTVSGIELQGSEALYRRIDRDVVAIVDDDGDASELRFDWGKAASCPMPANDVAAATRALETARLTSAARDHAAITPDTMDPFCVWVVVTDRFGASATTAKTFTPTDRPPTGQLEVNRQLSSFAPAASTAYPLFTRFRIDADIQDPDGDPLALTWAVKGPNGDVAAMPCPDNSESLCFQALVAGDYDVSAAQQGGSKQWPLTLTVLPDQPACLAAFRPSVRQNLHQSAVGQLSLAVERIADDGDAFPATSSDNPEYKLTWKMRVEDQPEVRLAIGEQKTELVLPEAMIAAFRGKTVTFIVEVHDRAHQTVDPTTCNADGTECALPLQPGQTCLTRAAWTVEFDL